jgi:hypothetical protein
MITHGRAHVRAVLAYEIMDAGQRENSASKQTFNAAAPYNGANRLLNADAVFVECRRSDC